MHGRGWHRLFAIRSMVFQRAICHFHDGSRECRLPLTHQVWAGWKQTRFRHGVWNGTFAFEQKRFNDLGHPKPSLPSYHVLSPSSPAPQALRDALSVANWSLASGARVRETSLRSSRRPWSEGSFSWSGSSGNALGSLTNPY